ncbi:hypothetical protein RW1_019_00030 [Rhodococcus wratislaviensis NBRC 100605]|uniref:Uncharacterized protein n=1 Tax=Rhodococcus wratislaviensis NBRC 100605 TaxID=1219028 RepID=X0Q2L2_RHOWR|nr:hypothetical protein RW1_019_00030 [Rhodococcus wratislaviensis NBRC 100605]
MRDYQAAADAFGSAPRGSSGQDIGDWFSKAINGAKDVMRVFSYTIMKSRAGDIGRTGLTWKRELALDAREEKIRPKSTALEPRAACGPVSDRHRRPPLAIALTSLALSDTDRAVSPFRRGCERAKPGRSG